MAIATAKGGVKNSVFQVTRLLTWCTPDSVEKSNGRNHPIARSLRTLGGCLAHMLEVWDSLSLSGTHAMTELYWH